MDTVHLTGSIVLAVVGFVLVAEMPKLQAESSSEAPVGISAYRRFHANDSHIGKPISCTREEKVCFRYNVMKYEDECLHELHIQLICEFIGDRNELFHGSGHLVPKCDLLMDKFDDPCPGYRMAYDGRCYTKEIVRDVICGCNAEPTRYFLGGMECRCSPPTRIDVQQPEEDGKCLIPDLRFPDTRDRFVQYVNALEGMFTVVLNCSADQARCFSMGKVWMEKGPGCFSLWEMGSCPAEHLVVLDGQAALQGRAEGVCVHERGGCPQGQRRMAFDQCCYHDAELKLIRLGQEYLTEYGNRVWTKYERGYRNITLKYEKINNTNQCIINQDTGFIMGPKHWPSPPCGQPDQGKCPLYEVENQSPKPN